MSIMKVSERWDERMSEKSIIPVVIAFKLISASVPLALFKGTSGPYTLALSRSVAGVLQPTRIEPSQR